MIHLLSLWEDVTTLRERVVRSSHIGLRSHLWVEGHLIDIILLLLLRVTSIRWILRSWILNISEGSWWMVDSMLTCHISALVQRVSMIVVELISHQMLVSLILYIWIFKIIVCKLGYRIIRRHGLERSRRLT